MKVNHLHKIFKKNKIAIGMIHLKPMIGYQGFSSYDDVLSSAIKDAIALEKGGIDGIMIENNYDLPHKILVDKETISMFTAISLKIKEKVKSPLGICVLWNDYKAALTIAKTIEAKFIRVPVFVDDVETSYGVVNSNPKDVISYRRHLNGESIALLTDIHVKHSKLLSKYSLEESSKRAVKFGSNALIITGKWTGDAPNTHKLKKVRTKINNFPIIAGSGATTSNLNELLKYVDGVIVGTTLKSGKNNSKNIEVNIKSYQERIDINKVRNFMSVFNKVSSGFLSHPYPV